MTALFFKMHTVLYWICPQIVCFATPITLIKLDMISSHTEKESAYIMRVPPFCSCSLSFGHGLIRRDCCLSVAYILEYILLVSARHINSKNVGFVHTAVILRFVVPDVLPTPHQLSGQNCTWSKLTNVRKFVVLKILSCVQFAYYSMTHWQKLD